MDPMYILCISTKVRDMIDFILKQNAGYLVADEVRRLDGI